ncbi:hypothetical protein HYN56_12845 [Flavobacterium crocinum]|uniref:Uncharacterized protein n=1 Tax=Flavobacterium crocinum TaxID=2183896 RepID=A0A2S1YLW2_9FLAO|nr:hypothetical protein HYN56_12845 [Flavobacterium crocinum]
MWVCLVAVLISFLILVMILRLNQLFQSSFEKIKITSQKLHNQFYLGKSAEEPILPIFFMNQIIE